MDWIEAWLMTTNILFLVAALSFMLQATCRFDRCQNEQFTRAYLKQLCNTCSKNKKNKKENKNKKNNKKDDKKNTETKEEEKNDNEDSITIEDDDDDEDEDEDEDEDVLDQLKGDPDDHFNTSRQVRSLMRRDTLQSAKFDGK